MRGPPHAIPYDHLSDDLFGVDTRLCFEAARYGGAGDCCGGAAMLSGAIVWVEAGELDVDGGADEAGAAAQDPLGALMLCHAPRAKFVIVNGKISVKSRTSTPQPLDTGGQRSVPGKFSSRYASRFSAEGRYIASDISCSIRLVPDNERITIPRSGRYLPSPVETRCEGRGRLLQALLRRLGLRPRLSRAAHMPNNGAPGGHAPPKRYRCFGARSRRTGTSTSWRTLREALP
jgi:hypothetical protein